MTALDAISIVRLALCAFIEIGCAVVIARLDLRHAYAKRPYWVRQCAAGAVFGLAAIAATELGIEVGGASVNLRDAAPLISGLLFGGPSGILAGVIGGAERFAAASWGVGTYTRDACSIAAVLAGLFAAALRKWFFENKRPTWPYGLLIGIAAEAAHMLLIFFTHLDDVGAALIYVEKCAFPMMLGTGLCVMAAVAAVRKADPDGTPAHQPTSLEARLQKSLAITLSISLAAAMALTWGVQSMLAADDTETLLRVQLRDVPDELNDAIEDALAEYTVWLGQEYDEDGAVTLAGAGPREGVREVLVIDEDGTVVSSTDPALIGEDLAESDQAREYLSVTSQGMAGPRQASFFDPGVLARYGAVRTENGKILIAEYTDAFVAEQLRRQIALGALHRHIGTSGYLMLADAHGTVLSGPYGIGKNLKDLGFSLDGDENTMLEADVDGDKMQYLYARMDSAVGMCTGICAVPKSETDLNALVDIYLTLFSVILIFFALFLVLSVLLRKGIVGEIHTVNSSLGRITAGDLECAVNVRSSDEFGILSDGINETVASLRDLIAREAARVDEELELARVIQRTSLPSVFPSRDEFEIYAMMIPAREVGGDFYDFYMLGDDRLAFLAADVSGKGIPAAMFMMRAKTELKSLAESGLPLTEVFRRVNDALCENNEASMFVTVWMGVLDVQTGQVEYVNAGHNPPILLRPGAEPVFAKGQSGFVLGGLEGFSYEVGSLTLAPQNTLILYTDGVTEAQNSGEEQFLDTRLIDSVRRNGRSAEEVCVDVRSAVSAFVGGAEQFDDLTILALRYFGAGSQN